MKQSVGHFLCADYVQNLKDTNSDPIQLEVDKNISPLKVGDEIFVKFDENCLFDFC